MKQKVIIYGLGNCWDDHWQEIAKDYDISCCIDKNIEKKINTKGFRFDTPDQIINYEYEKLIICAYGVGIGIREEIILLWDIPLHKIYYFSELFYNSGIRSEQRICQHNYMLTIVIPTFNRRDRLIRTLEILSRQTCKNFNIIILDNASDYDVTEILKRWERQFGSKVEIRRNLSNIGMQGNLAMLFLQVGQGWMWTLSDDDIPSVYAVETIMREIEKNNDVGVFWFSIYDIKKYLNEDGRCIRNLTELAEFYQRLDDIDKGFIEGDFIYLSNKVYNVQNIKEYSEKVFTYLYTGIPQLMPILHLLNDKKSQLVISNKKIVAYASPEGDHWDWLKVALGMSTITDIPLEYANNEVRKTLYHMIMLKPKDVLNAARQDITCEKLMILEKLYHNIYKVYLDEKESKKYLKELSLMKQFMP